MEKLSVTVITKNEEHNIADALLSVDFADEIVVVDSGSEDRTVEIARRFTDRVIEKDWPGHVAQKNYAVEAASHDWILSIDADERVSPELAAGIRRVLAEGPDRDGYRVRRKVFYLGRWIRHCGWYPDYRVRLFDRRKAKWTGLDPHDIVEVHGETGRIEADLLHYTYRDISDHLGTIDSYTTIGARRYKEAGRRAGAWDILLRPPYTFLKKYVFQRGFLDGFAGLLISMLSAYYVFLKYAKLWEMGRKGEE